MMTNLRANTIQAKYEHGTIDGKTCSNQINLVFSIENLILSVLSIIS